MNKMSRFNSNSDAIHSYHHLVFVVDRLLICRFFALLQQGVMVRCHIGCSIAQFLREELGAGTEVLEMIQSVILDGRPVDDLEATRIRDGSILALSAAMPGLVGATLRRGGAYSSFRSAITYHETGELPARKEGHIRVKLFNLLMSELGPGLLQRGVFLGSLDMISFILGQSRDFWEGCRRITLDGAPIESEKHQIAARLSDQDQVFLIVIGR